MQAVCVHHLTDSRKLAYPEPIIPEESLETRINARGAELSELAEKLQSANDVRHAFPKPVTKMDVHIVVQVSAAGGWHYFLTYESPKLNFLLPTTCHL